jgi:ATP-dependent Lon protease
LIEGYCKEAGVRNLVRKTNQIFQKLAFRYVKNITFEKVVKPEHLKEFIGLEVFHESRLFPGAPPAGVMIGLAYNNYGGSIMYVECANQGRPTAEIAASAPATGTSALPVLSSGEEVKSGGSLLVTGNIHDVMKESCQLAYTYAKYITSTFFSNHYLEANDVHLNFP